jgi:hypothetical protein
MPWANEDKYRVASFDQAKAWGKLLERLRHDISAHEGVCQELSAKWVRMVIRALFIKPCPYPEAKAKNLRTPEGRMLNLQQASTFKKAIIAHERGVTPLGQKGFLTDHPLLKDKPFGSNKPFALPQDHVNEAYGVQAKLHNINGTSVDQIATMVTPSKSTCFIILLSCSRGKHAVACFTGHSVVPAFRDVFFFDPNYGEYKLNCTNFKAWFLDYLGQALYMNTNDPKKFGTIQIYTCQNKIMPKNERRTKSPDWVDRMVLMKELMQQNDKLD